MVSTEALRLATTLMDPENTTLSERQDTEGHMGRDSTDGKRPEPADPQTQRVGSWLPRRRGTWGVTI